MEQASLNIGTIGQRLEAARQAKGVTVSEAGAATKILSKFIEAMEADDFGALSAPVYAKSFIKMYAQYLGIDARPLVDEYIDQHVPKAKAKLNSEVRQNLAKIDQAPDDAKAQAQPAPPPPRNHGKEIFGGVNEAIANLSSSGIPVKLIVSVVAAVAVFGIIAATATQCSDDEAEAPAGAAGAASATAKRAVIAEGVPDAYLVKPGVIEVDK